MKKLFVIALALGVLALTSGQANAEGGFKLNVGGDVLLPMGDFGDAVSTGFGGSVRGEYMLSPEASLTLMSGYYTWSGKDLAPGFDFSFKGVPVMAGVKYYFMPEGSARVYGAAELGMFFGTTDVTITLFGTTVSGSTSESNFAYAPSLGVEIPMGSSATLDIAARYFSVATTGSSSSNLGFRAGVGFNVGN